MSDFTSDELKVIGDALEFYKYEMNKTEDMNEYRAWKSAIEKYLAYLDIYRGVYKIKQLKQDDDLKHAMRKYELEWGE